MDHLERPRHKGHCHSPVRVCKTQNARSVMKLTGKGVGAMSWRSRGARLAEGPFPVNVGRNKRERPRGEARRIDETAGRFGNASGDLDATARVPEREQLTKRGRRGDGGRARTNTKRERNEFCCAWIEGGTEEPRKRDGVCKPLRQAEVTLRGWRRRGGASERGCQHFL